MTKPLLRGKRRVFFRILAALIGVLLSVSLLEAAALLRLVDYRTVFAWGPQNALDNPRNRFDPELIFIHRPNGRFVGTSRGDVPPWLTTALVNSVDVRYDAHGFRNDRDLDRADVVLIGDSYIESALVPYDRIVSTRLAHTLTRPVLNLGHVGYGPQQERVVLQRYGLPVRPRVVVWQFCEGNDLEDWQRYHWQVTHLEAIQCSMECLYSRCFTRNLMHAVQTRLHRRAFDANLARRHSGTWRGAPDESVRTLYFLAPFAPLDPAGRTALEGTEDILGDAAEACRNSGVQFLLLFVPTKFRVYHELCDFPADSKPARWVPTDLPELMRAWGASRQIPFLDLTAPLHSAAVAGRLVYFTDDTHWNDDGCEVVAREIANFLRQNRLVD